MPHACLYPWNPRHSLYSEDSDDGYGSWGGSASYEDDDDSGSAGEFVVERADAKLSECEEEEEEEENDVPDEDEDEVGLWQAIDAAQEEDHAGAITGLHQLCDMLDDGLEGAALVVPGSRRSRVLVGRGPYQASERLELTYAPKPIYCEGCQLMRWPQPLFDSGGWPRTAKRIQMDRNLRGRQYFAHGLGEVNVCSCDESQREALQESRMLGVVARDAAARRSATCGADHLKAAVAGAAVRAMRLHAGPPELHLTDTQRRQSRQVAEQVGNAADNLLRQLFDGDWSCQHSDVRRLAAHCSDTVGSLAPGLLTRGAFNVLSVLVAAADGPVAGLPWVGYACMQLTGASLSSDLLGLIGQHVRQPRIDFVAAGGIPAFVARARRNTEAPWGEYSYSSMSTGDLVRVLSVFAEDTQVSAAALVEAGAHTLMAELIQPHLHVRGVGIHLEHSEYSRQASDQLVALCVKSLGAISAWGGDASIAVTAAESEAAAKNVAAELAAAAAAAVAVERAARRAEAEAEAAAAEAAEMAELKRRRLEWQPSSSCAQCKTRNKAKDCQQGYCGVCCRGPCRRHSSGRKKARVK